MGLILKPGVGLRPRWNNNPMGISPPVGAWVMNEGSGGKAFDLSQNENYFTFESGAASPAWIQGNIYFDGGDGARAITKTQLTFPGQEFTIIVKVKQASDFVGYLLSKFNNSSLTDSWGFYLNNGVPILTVRQDGDAVDSSTGASALTANVWTDVAVTYDNKAVKHYKNGILDVSDTLTTSIQQDVSSPVFLGCRGNGVGGIATQMTGYQEFCYLFAFALSSAQIAYIYQYPYYAWEYPELWEYYAAVGAGAAAPTGVFYGPFVGPFGGPI